MCDFVLYSDLSGVASFYRVLPRNIFGARFSADMSANSDCRGLIAQTFSGKTNKIQECETAPQCTVATCANLKMDVKSIFCTLEASNCTKE